MKARTLIAWAVALLVLAPAARGSAASTLIVDDDLSCDGAAYASIGAAVAAAGAGDQIVVCAGTYAETGIVLDEPVSIEGQLGEGSVQIDGGGTGPAFEVTATDVTLRFLEIFDVTVGIEVDTPTASRTLLHEVAIWSATDAAVLVPAGGVVEELRLEHALPVGEGGDGIRLEANADVGRLEIIGGYLAGRSALDVAEAQSVLVNGSYIGGSPIDIRRAGSVTVMNSVFDRAQLVVGTGAPDVDSDTSVLGVDLRDNFVLDPPGSAFSLHRTFDARIIDNSVFVDATLLTTPDAIIDVDVSDGIFGNFQARRNVPVLLDGNSISYSRSLTQTNTSAAIGLRGALSSVSLTDNGLSGLEVQQHPSARPFAGIVIDTRQIRGDIDVHVQAGAVRGFHAGLLIDGSGLGEDAHVSARGVSFSGNLWGVLNADGAPVDARCNWWGDPLGPTGEGNGLTGDAVSTNVTYSPWLPAPVKQGAVLCDLL